MKNILTSIIALVALVSAYQANAQTTYTFDLGSSFSPAWTAAGTSGTATNINSSGINCTVNFALSGSGAIVAPYPRVNVNNSNASDFQVQGSTDAMELDINLGNKTSYVDVTYTFSAAIQNVNFGISDIDMPGGSSPYAYVDQVTVTGTGAAGTVLPTLTKYNTSSTVFNISGNTGTGNASSSGSNVSSLNQNSAAQDGTMFVNFAGNAITSITVRYTTLNAASVNADPGLQAIALGNITFQKAIAPVTSNVSNPAIKNVSGSASIAALSGTDDESVASYTVATIPSALAGTLYYNNGTSYVAVAAGQVLTPAQAASLKFTPVAAYTGNAVFTYTATDNRGLVSNTSNYTIPVTSSLLPVTLSNFSGAWNGSSITLTWTTQQEFNSATFIVEKSNNGTNWQTLATVAAAGNSQIPVVYYYSDAQPFTVTYYRLKQVDVDGAYVYSKVVKMTNGDNGFSVKIFPNPVTSKATVSTTSTSNKTISVKVFSNNGALVREMTAQLVAGVNNFDIPSVNTLPNGIYSVVINDNNQPAIARFVKQ